MGGKGGQKKMSKKGGGGAELFNYQRQENEDRRGEMVQGGGFLGGGLNEHLNEKKGTVKKEKSKMSNRLGPARSKRPS